MKRYYARGGLQAMAPAPPVASYYTYGAVPEDIWPVRNEAPLSQVQQEDDEQMFGDQEQGFAAGGYAQGSNGGEGALATLDPEGPIAGPGTGRSDDIDARLSDGEYVVDAEAVAMLGDGSTAAGAEALDRMIEQVRMHKGRALAKGKFSPPARSPLDYLAGDE
jgi:hypothetical protein